MRVFLNYIKGVYCFTIMISIMACAEEPDVSVIHPIFNIPAGFPQPVYPIDNELTPERWALGKRLFFDPILSVDQSISCVNCHRPELAFTDGKSVSVGVAERTGMRNAPTLVNVAYHPYYTREGGVPTLEMQVLVPIQEHAEFDFNILEIANRLLQDSTYVQASLTAYNRIPDAFVITRAISCFERSILSGNSRYDQFNAGMWNALNALEKKGQQLFFSDRLACAKCHAGFNLTNYSFENTGLYEDYADPGRFRFTENESDRALFKVPTLRNVSVTAPYMHDGSFPDLTSVIEHYNKGGKSHPHKNPLIKPLYLSTSEKRALLAFLNSFTDEEFLANPNHYK